MSIRVVCPNGHLLRVQESSAGKTGLCPVCRALVRVPEPAAPAAVSEDAILGFLGPQQPKPAPVAKPAQEAAAKPATEGHVPPKKSCDRCNEEIPAGTHICPYCHTYVGGVSLL